MARTEVSRIALFLTLISNLTVLGDDTNKDIVPYAKQPYPFLMGLIKVWECWDSKCLYCQQIEAVPMRFGKCHTKPHCSEIYDCTSPTVIYYKWRQPECNGYPYKQQAAIGCYKNNRFDTNPPNQSIGQCGSGYEGNRGSKFYKYECSMQEEGGEELRYTTEDDENSDDGHMNMGVLATVFLIVCLIGFIVGYLIYKKRKQSAAKYILCDESQATELSA